MSSLVNNNSLRQIMVRGLSAQAAASLKQQAYSLPHHQPKSVKNSRGELIASLENNSPLSHIAIYVKSGSRYEGAENAGVSHVARIAAGLASKNISAFMFTRKFQQMGATVVCENGREHMAYRMTMMRDFLNEENFAMLTELATQPAFKPWEMDTIVTRLLTELEARDATTRVVDLLHEAAFRDSALGRSLFVPDHRIGKVTVEQLREFIDKTHCASRLAVVGLGVEQETLIGLSRIVPLPEGTGTAVSSTQAVYHGGEIRHETGSQLAHVAVAGPGAKMGSKEAVALAVAQFVLGASASTKYGANPASKLAQWAGSAGESAVAAPVNAAYTDAGLFGFVVTDLSQNISKSLSSIVKGMRSLKVTSADVDFAKNKAKSALLMSAESSVNELEEMGLSALLGGELKTVADVLASIDAVTQSDVQTALSTALKGKPSMVSIGGIHNVPYLDQL